MNKLDEIIAHKHTEVQRLLPRAEKLRAAAALRDDVRSFYDALRADPTRLSIIAEVKRASPSAGTIAADFDPLTIARGYEKAGASAISVLTDEKYFQGRLEYLTLIREQLDIPCLRKDFIIHEAQIFEAVVAGADAILLIVAALDQPTLEHLLEVAHTFQLDALVEVHDLPELERALATDARIIGVNNRNLKSFTVDLSTTTEGSSPRKCRMTSCSWPKAASKRRRRRHLRLAEAGCGCCSRPSARRSCAARTFSRICGTVRDSPFGSF
jgi:indole-3-glycerol phosphate synthase